MSNRLLISVAAAALLAGGMAAHAQGTGGAAGAGSSGAMEREASPSAGGASERGGAAATPMNRDSKAGSDMQSSQSEEHAPPGKGKSAQDTSPQKGGKEMNPNAQGERDQNMDRNAEGERGRDQNMNRNAEGERGRDQNMNRNAQGERDRSSTTTGQAGAGAKLSSEQRTKITTVIRDQHIQPQTNINFSISVGTRVPRDVRFHPLPSDIVTVYPDWRGYEFFLVSDQIVIVDPRTMEIVAVLDA